MKVGHNEFHLDLSFIVGALIGFILSRSGIIGVLAGIVIGILISQTQWCSWEYISEKF